jgi:hypothetical protein
MRRGSAQVVFTFSLGALLSAAQLPAQAPPAGRIEILGQTYEADGIFICVNQSALREGRPRPPFRDFKELPGTPRESDPSVG